MNVEIITTKSTYVPAVGDLFRLRGYSDPCLRVKMVGYETEGHFVAVNLRENSQIILLNSGNYVKLTQLEPLKLQEEAQ